MTKWAGVTTEKLEKRRSQFFSEAYIGVAVVVS